MIILTMEKGKNTTVSNLLISSMSEKRIVRKKRKKSGNEMFLKRESERERERI